MCFFQTFLSNCDLRKSKKKKKETCKKKKFFFWTFNKVSSNIWPNRNTTSVFKAGLAARQLWQEGEFHPRGKSHNFHTGSELTLTGPGTLAGQAISDKSGQRTNEVGATTLGRVTLCLKAVIMMALCIMTLLSIMPLHSDIQHDATLPNDS